MSLRGQDSVCCCSYCGKSKVVFGLSRKGKFVVSSSWSELNSVSSMKGVDALAGRHASFGPS